jgi:hypothetical protein
VLAEQAHLRALGIIDEQGNLLKRPSSQGGGDRDDDGGGW